MMPTNLEVTNVGKETKSIYCIINHTVPAKNWELCSEYAIPHVFEGRPVNQCLSDTLSPGAIADRIVTDDDHQTVLALLGI